MTTRLAEIEQVLRGPSATVSAATQAGARVWQLAVYTLVFGAFYGAVMGTFGGVAGDRSLQILVSAAKVPLLLLVTFSVSLPSFFVLNTLFGVRSDFAVVLRALVSSQAGLTVVLAALAPYTLVWYGSTSSYRWALLFNGLMFAIASVTANVLLRMWYRPLLVRRPHRWLLRIWLVVYVLVAVQMAWILRPFVGDPGLPIQFFRNDALGVAYLNVARTVWETLTRW